MDVTSFGNIKTLQSFQQVHWFPLQNDIIQTFFLEAKGNELQWVVQAEPIKGPDYVEFLLCCEWNNSLKHWEDQPYLTIALKNNYSH